MGPAVLLAVFPRPNNATFRHGRTPPLLLGKLLGEMAFGLTVTAVVLLAALLVFGAGGVN